MKKYIKDFVMIKFYILYQNLVLFWKKIKKDPIIIVITLQIMRKSVNDQIVFNIINLKNQKKVK